MTQAGHITVTHGSLTVDVPRSLFKGPSCEIDEAAINDMELLEDLEELDQGNPLRVPSALRRLLGEQGKRALYDHLRTESGRVPVDKVSVELAEIFGGLKSKKK